ncbi:HAD family phosphatase [Candidatus Peregrinibacteria bacterium]|jgi:phosphoglycolate phosphatase|nr:HAD family phosphatase [Candidatus Peregrinibacteria bacterium]MBT3598227.1 HAD family phosphatase [Candidatus Peregrinibacteria bacterium]MBT4367147.1 HAD family phosphatase [Candidatus Peregrinibacteria bacterium]MBT4585805.1 HAD family phosphatase [Candidatus Peregrinibacteria bacterium]MBT6730935.1 HAD family phosphatase [Candidatus Peregrinibacteria bacterium]
MKYSAILFDLDGTLIDTIPLWQKAYLQTLHDEGINMELDEFMERIYHKNEHFITIFKEFGFPEKEWERIREDRDSRYCDLLRNNSEWIDGALEMLNAAKVESPIGMMTGSWKRYTDAIDEKLGIYDKFESTITCDDTQGGRSKPHPYGLELLANKMGVEPEKCLYIGDQLFDIEAANAAGMTSCLIWQEWTPIGADENAKVVCENYEELIKQF